MKRRLIILLLFAVCLWPVRAQQFLDNSKDYDFTRNYRHWGVSLSGNVFPFESHTAPRAGTLFYRYYLAWGWQAGLAYHWRLNNYLGIKFNLTAGRSPVFTYTFSLPGSERADGKAYYAGVPGKYAWSFHLPVGFEVRSFAVPRYIFFLQGGLDAGYLPGLVHAASYGDHLGVAFASASSWQFDPYVAVGWYYAFPWALWETDVVYRINAGKPDYTGAYTVTGLQQTADFGGTIRQPGSYFGLRFVWYFYRYNRRTGAECPGQVHSRKVLARRRAEDRARKRAERIKLRERKRALRHQRRMNRHKRRRRRRR